MIQLEIKLPLKGLSPNDRLHWSSLRKVSEAYRKECWIAAHNAKVRGAKPFTVPIVIDQEWFMAKAPGRLAPRDEDNCRSCLKAALDGIRDAKLIPEDTSRWVAWGTFTAHRTKKEHRGRSCIVLTLRPRDPNE